MPMNRVIAAALHQSTLSERSREMARCRSGRPCLIHDRDMYWVVLLLELSGRQQSVLAGPTVESNAGSGRCISLEQS